MTLVLLLMFATVLAGTLAAMMWRWSGAAGPNVPSTLGTAREAGRAMRSHPGPGTAVAKRLDPRAATGLALALALVVIVVVGLLLGVLAYLVRGSGDLVQLDESVANWGDRHASAFSTDGLTAISHLGEPVVIVALAVVLAVAETVRTRSVWVVPFLLIVIGRKRHPHDDGQTARRSRAAGAQPDRRNARTVVPQRPLVVVRCLLRRSGTAAHPQPSPGSSGQLSQGSRFGSSSWSPAVACFSTCTG